MVASKPRFQGSDVEIIFFKLLQTSPRAGGVLWNIGFTCTDDDGNVPTVRKSGTRENYWFQFYNDLRIFFLLALR